MSDTASATRRFNGYPQKLWITVWMEGLTGALPPRVMPQFLYCSFFNQPYFTFKINALHDRPNVSLPLQNVTRRYCTRRPAMCITGVRLAQRGALCN